MESSISHLLITLEQQIHANSQGALQQFRGVTNSEIVATLDRELSSADNLIASLQRLLIEKTQARNRCASISLLPLPILSQVLLLACSSPAGPTNHNTGPSRFFQPLIFGNVCAAWRSVAWETPRLWTSVHCFVAINPRRSKTQAVLLKMWIERAKGLPLTIKISPQDESAWVGNDIHVDIIDVLMQFCSTWKDVDLVVPFCWLTRMNLLRPNLLESLRIRPPISPAFDDKTLICFSQARNLFCINYTSFLLKNITLPWTKITKATIGGPSLDEAIELIYRCSALVECHIFDPKPEEFFYPIFPTTHTSMEMLSIIFSADKPATILASRIINILTAPHLQKLSLTLPRLSHEPLPRIISFINRSNCPLKDVEVFGPKISEGSIIQFLCNATPVVSLRNYPISSGARK